MELTAEDRILVTGATGLVGSHVAERSIGMGVPTRVVVRNPEAASWLSDLGVEVVAGDMTDAESLGKAVEGVTVVVHCAAHIWQHYGVAGCCHGCKL